MVPHSLRAQTSRKDEQSTVQSSMNRRPVEHLPLVNHYQNMLSLNLPHSWMKFTKQMGEISNGKAPGCDDIPAELWKASGEDGVKLTSCGCCVTKSGGRWNGLPTGKEQYSSRFPKKET